MTDDNDERIVNWPDSHGLSLIFEAKDRATL